MSFPRIATLLVVALPLVACDGGTGEGASDEVLQLATAQVEFQDIFIPDRLIEIPVLAAGTEVISEVYIHNAGDQDLTLNEVSLNYQSDSNWSLVTETVPEFIGPHGHAVVEVRYIASDTIATFAALDVYSDDPDEAEKTVAFIGYQATGGAEARVSANILDWGFRFTGEESRKILEIDNLGSDDLRITSVELIQSEAQPAFGIACPGQALDACDWTTEILPSLLSDAIVPGSAALLELTFIPLNLQGVSAQLKIGTDDPVRPEFTIFLLGNGGSALNCTPPTVQVVDPTEAVYFHSWQDMTVTARVHDQEQPADSLYVEMYLGSLLLENEFPDENGFVTFFLDLDDHNPAIPTGLQPFTLKVSDGCPLYGYDTLVVAIDFPLSTQDVDGDGFDENQGDCDENNAQVYPESIEVYDGFDNNCDGQVDEQTEVWDDDCDGYCEHGVICLGPAACIADSAAPYNDCNDSIEDLNDDGAFDGLSIYPDAEEVLNFIDDDCDGNTDEGTTFFDDDGDGQTEAVGDCDDENERVFAGATEWCDEVDNDCDGEVDNSCIDATAPPRIIGGIIAEKFQVELGSRIQAQVLVVSPEDNLDYVWFSDLGGWYDEPANGPVVFWNAPEDSDDNNNLVGEFPNLMVTVTDSLGQSATGFGNVLISQEITTAYSPVSGAAAGGGGSCAVVARRPAPAGPLVALLALLGLGFRELRRRR